MIKRLKLKKSLLVLLAFVFYNISISAQNELQEIDKIINAEMKKRNITGVSLALIDSTGILLSKGYGFADKMNNKPATAQTVYPFGSISKLITMASVLRLQDLNKLKIDSPFVKYVPEFQMKQHFKESKPFSVFDLLTQQAGIPRTRLKDLYTDFAHPTDFYKIIDEEKEDYLIAKPKDVYQYSDIGISMLGLLPFKTVQTDYVDFVKKEIFEPIGMKNASFNKSLSKEKYTKGYEKGEEAKIYATRFLPAFGLQANVEDMAKFAFVFLNNGKSIENKQVISADLVSKSISHQNSETQLAFSNKLGLTWWLNNFYGYQSVFHGGEQKPCLSMIRLLPEHKLGLILVINSDMNGDFLATVTEQVLLKLLKFKKITVEKNYYDKFKVKKANNDMQYLIDSMVGDYATSYGLINISKKGTRVKVNLMALGKKLDGKLMSDSTLQLRYMLLGFIPIKVMRLFIEDVNGRKIVGTKSALSGRKIFGGEKLVFSKRTTAWDNIGGEYTICNLSAEEYPLLKKIEITDYKGIKVISGQGDIPDVEKFQFCISPINDNLALVQGIGGLGLLGETIKRFEKNGEEFIDITGYLFKKTMK